jgi:hypothetical protein
MKTRKELYAEIGERNRRLHRRDERSRRWFWVRVLLLCFLWSAVGLALGALAFRVHDEELGRILLLAGQLVTWVGVLATVAWALIASQSRGWR